MINYRPNIVSANWKIQIERLLYTSNPSISAHITNYNNLKIFNLQKLCLLFHRARIFIHMCGN